MYIGYSKILPHSLTRRVPKLRIGGLQQESPAVRAAGQAQGYRNAASLLRPRLLVTGTALMMLNRGGERVRHGPKK